MSEVWREQAALPEDTRSHALRPSLIEEFVGQSKIIENLKIFIVRLRAQSVLDHVSAIWTTWIGKNYIGSYHSKRT